MIVVGSGVRLSSIICHSVCDWNIQTKQKAAHINSPPFMCAVCDATTTKQVHRALVNGCQRPWRSRSIIYSFAQYTHAASSVQSSTPMMFILFTIYYLYFNDISLSFWPLCFGVRSQLSLNCEVGTRHAFGMWGMCAQRWQKISAHLVAIFSLMNYLP